jgi:hypothetical protein
MPESLTPSPEQPTLELRVWFLTFDAHRVIYATIMLMTAYAIYDEGTDPFSSRSLLELSGIALAPLFALTMAHAFSDALDLQIRNGRRLTGHDRRHLLSTNIQYLYVAIPPVLLTIVLAAVGWNANLIVEMVQFLGLASLFLWGVYAARAAGIAGWRRLSFGLSYGIMGLIVIGVELILTH